MREAAEAFDELLMTQCKREKSVEHIVMCRGHVLKQLRKQLNGLLLMVGRLGMF